MSQFQILGLFGSIFSFIPTLLEMLLANSGDPDQMAPELGVQVLPLSHRKALSVKARY